MGSSLTLSIGFWLFEMIMIGFNHILWSPEFKSLVRVAMGSSLALSIKFWLFRNDHDQIQPYSLKSWIWISCENCYGVKRGLVHQVLTFSKWSWWDSTIFFEVLNFNLLWELLWDQAWPCPSTSDFFEMIMMGFNHILWSPESDLVDQVLTLSKWSWSDSTIFFKVLNLNLLWDLLWDQAWPCPSGSDFSKWSWSDSTIFFEVLNLNLL